MASSSVDVAAIRRMVNSPSGGVWRFMFRLGYRIRNNASVRCNVDTGRLRASLFVVMLPGPTVRVGSDVTYAVYVHEGTAPHVIVPVRARALRFTTAAGVTTGPRGGIRSRSERGVVFAKRVNHPGYRGNPFLRDAMVEEVGRL